MNQNLNEVKEIIQKNIPLINYHFNKENVKPRNDGKYFTSEQFIRNVSTDIDIGEEKYYYSFGTLHISDKLYTHIEKLFPGYTPLVSGHFYYPKGGFMSWHTNSDKPEKHVYITYVDEPNKSFFRSFVDDEIITDYDSDTINIRVFDIVDTEPYYWHCVYSDCNRYSFGFRLFKK